MVYNITQLVLFVNVYNITFYCEKLLYYSKLYAIISIEEVIIHLPNLLK